MYYVKALAEHENYQKVHLTKGKSYHVIAMQPSAMEGVEFKLVGDKGIEKWHHNSWFEKEIKWVDEQTKKKTA